MGLTHRYMVDFFHIFTHYSWLDTIERCSHISIIRSLHLDYRHESIRFSQMIAVSFCFRLFDCGPALQEAEIIKRCLSRRFQSRETSGLASEDFHERAQLERSATFWSDPSKLHPGRNAIINRGLQNHFSSLVAHVCRWASLALRQIEKTRLHG